MAGVEELGGRRWPWGITGGEVGAGDEVEVVDVVEMRLIVMGLEVDGGDV